MNKIRKLLRIATLGVLGAAVYQEMSKDPSERTGEGMVGGVIPYDFRPPTFQRIKDSLWNPTDPRVLVPSVFGVGWTINFARLFALVTAERS